MGDSSLTSQRVLIIDSLLSYTRGIDRLDAEAVSAAFHPGAILHHCGPEPMVIGDFVEYALPSLRKRFVATQHRVSNIRVEIDGDHALVESYVLAFHVEDTDGEKKLHTFNGRYIDQFERKNDFWRIQKRQLRNDWSKVESISEEMSGSAVWEKSARDSSDPIYTQ